MIVPQGIEPKPEKDPVTKTEIFSFKIGKNNILLFRAEE